MTAVFAAAFLIHGCAWNPMISLPPEDRQEDTSASSLPPLVVDTGAPLLLDDPPEAAGYSTTPAALVVADNSSCFVCHANYMEEELATQHAVQNLGCENCHGKSIAHKNDENNTTPPDVMFPADKIDAACMQCHLTHDAPAAKVIARWRERCPDKTDPATIVCTDCHGNHRLKIRTVRWDKRTGKLLKEPKNG
jgi:hypothetical protein